MCGGLIVHLFGVIWSLKYVVYIGSPFYPFLLIKRILLQPVRLTVQSAVGTLIVVQLTAPEEPVPQVSAYCCSRCRVVVNLWTNVKRAILSETMENLLHGLRRPSSSLVASIMQLVCQKPWLQYLLMYFTLDTASWTLRVLDSGGFHLEPHHIDSAGYNDFVSSCLDT